ncbi:MAG: hypothetical protein C5S48_00500 [Candidatus Methanogaster sp.]|nr:MAG: hypothetical protein C5S48_00500 [ANME-2 cluster archaeon]
MEGKTVIISLNGEQAELLKSLKGKGFGTKDAEIIKNIFITYISEKSPLKNCFGAQEEVGEMYGETFWARQRELLKEKDKFVSIDEI